jgi:hypothetical protein
MSWEKRLNEFEDNLNQEETARLERSSQKERDREQARKKYLSEWQLAVKTFAPPVNEVCKRFSHVIRGQLTNHPTSLIASKPCLWADRDKRWNEPDESLPFKFGFIIQGPKDEYGGRDSFDVQIFTCGIDISTYSFTESLNSKLDNKNFVSLDADDFVLHSPSLPAGTYYWTWQYIFIDSYDDPYGGYWRRVHYLIPPTRFTQDLLAQLLETFYREVFSPHATIFKK